MIITAIFYLIYYAIVGVLTPIRLLPDASLPEEITNAITQAGQTLTAVESIIPVNTILLVLTSFLTIEASIFVYKVIMWVIKKIPSVN